jgi:uncharacterized protein
MNTPLFTKAAIETILKKKQDRVSEFSLSADLNFSTQAVRFDQDFLRLYLDSETFIDINSIKKKIRKHTAYCISGKGKLQPFHLFSEETNHVYKLLPTQDYPSFAISSTPMHQVSYSSPQKDTESKVKLLSPFPPRSQALDTCFGLGYSAIELAKYCQSVVSFEVDPTVLKLAGFNPYSGPAFSSEKIIIREEDVSQGIRSLESDAFEVVLHDPPTPKISTDLYRIEFYCELKRVLRPGGKLFHYCPRPNIKSRGRDFTTEVKTKLEQAEFKVLHYSEDAQGLLAR